MSSPWIAPDLPLAGLTDAQILIVTLYGEARSEPVEGQIAVACVIRNRTLAKGQTYRQVCLAPFQFSCWNPAGGQRNYDRVAALVARMAAGEALTADAKLRQLAWVAHGVVKDMLADTVKGARHYHTVALQPRPAWAQAIVPVMQKGNHLFYAGVA